MSGPSDMDKVFARFTLIDAQLAKVTEMLVGQAGRLDAIDIGLATLNGTVAALGATVETHLAVGH